jgi:hypothetical protein
VKAEKGRRCDPAPGVARTKLGLRKRSGRRPLRDAGRGKERTPGQRARQNGMLVVPGRARPGALPKGSTLGEKKKARTPCGIRAKFGGGRSPRALSLSHLLGALAVWRARCFPTPLTAASGALGLMAGPSRPFQARDLSSEASTPGSAATCRWHARRTGAGTPARNIRSGTLTTGTATADGGALAPCDGSDLLPLRLRSTCSWVIPVCGTAPSSEGWRVVAIPRRSPPRSALCAPRRLLSRALWKVRDLPGRNAADWSCSSSRNPLGNCLGAGPETGPGPDSARPRFLNSRLAAQLLSRRTGTVATPSRGTGETCLSRLAPRRGRTHQLRPPFPRLPGRIPVALSAGFSGRRALDCSIKERGDCPLGPRKCPPVVPRKMLTVRSEYPPVRPAAAKLFTGCSEAVAWPSPVPTHRPAGGCGSSPRP